MHVSFKIPMYLSSQDIMAYNISHPPVTFIFISCGCAEAEAEANQLIKINNKFMS